MATIGGSEMHGLEALKHRLNDAVTQFRESASDEEKRLFEDVLDRSHEQAVARLKGEPRVDEVGTPIAAWVKTGLEEADELLTSLVGREPVLCPDGTLAGTGKYEELDPLWALALIEYLDHRDHKAPFGDSPQIIEIENRASFAIVGDWGTGFWRKKETPAFKVARQVDGLGPSYTIHLGDVYYAGTKSEEHDNFLGVWPKGKVDQFALNSNHEMYTGGTYYFQGLNEHFPAQRGTSFFALTNENWLILGLDTAYLATHLYLHGNLGEDNAQTQFLSRMATEARRRRTIVLSHHAPLSAKGDEPTPILGQFMEAFGRAPEYWYWGHLHNAIVYKKSQDGYLGRCVGHGAVPYGRASILDGADGVEWYESELAGDPDIKDRVLNGFAYVTLDGAELDERLIGENGTQRWRPKLNP